MRGKGVNDRFNQTEDGLYFHQHGCYGGGFGAVYGWWAGTRRCVTILRLPVEVHSFGPGRGTSAPHPCQDASSHSNVIYLERRSSQLVAWGCFRCVICVKTCQMSTCGAREVDQRYVVCSCLFLVYWPIGCCDFVVVYRPGSLQQTLIILIVWTTRVLYFRAMWQKWAFISTSVWLLTRVK